MINIITSRKKLELILNKFDDCFNPTVSSIVGSLEKYSEKLFINAVNIAFYINNNAIGFASFYCNDLETKTAYLAQIAVLNDYTLKGYGGMLLKECESIARKKGMKKMRLEVYLQNELGLYFYKKNDYRIEKKCSKDSVYMIKDIGDNNE